MTPANSDNRAGLASRVDRRRFLRTTAVSTAAVLAGCRDPNDVEIGEETATPQEVERTNPDKQTLLLAPLVPTVALKTEDGDWIPRAVRTGSSPGWEIAVSMGEGYYPEQDKRESTGDGISPPDWVPDKYDASNIYNFVFYRVPSHLLVSASRGLADSSYPTGVNLSGTDLNFVRTNFDPTDSDTWPFGTVVAASNFGENQSDFVSPFGFGVDLGGNSRFIDHVQQHPQWVSRDSGGRLQTRTKHNYGATQTTADRLGTAGLAGVEELAEFYVNTVLTFSTGASLIKRALFRNLVKESAVEVTLKAAGGAETGFAIIEQAVSNGRAIRPPNASSEDLNEATSVTGSLFLPPLNDEMKTAIDTVSIAETPDTGVNTVDVGIGFSGPMVYLVDPPDSDDGQGPGEVVDVNINPQNTFLVTHNDIRGEPTIISLNDAGFEPGDRITIEVVGEYQYGRGEQSDTIAVFSGSAEFLGDCQLVDGEYKCSDAQGRVRVPDAIDAGPDVETGRTYYENYPTDIPEDFTIDGSVTVTIPEGATHLFLGANDDYYRDNRDPDGNYGVRIYEAE